MDVTPPETPPYRRLTLLDLMGLVVASGVGLVGWAWFQQILDHSPRWPESVEAWLHLAALQCLGLAWWVVLAGLRRWRSERREPGYLTAVGILTGSVFGAVLQFLYKTAGLLGTRSGLRVDLASAYVASVVYVGLPPVAAGVASVWVAVALLGAWRRAGGTRERIGLSLGGAVLALLVATIVRVWAKR